MGKVADNQSKKRLSILDSAYELFISKSFKNTSIDDVVKKAGIAKGTFYLYFRDKHDLMERLVIRKSMQVILSAFDRLKEEQEKCAMNFTQQTMFLMGKIIDCLEENREILTLVGKRFSACLRSLNTLEDEQLKAEIEGLIKANDSDEPFDNTKKKLYLIVDMVGSVCYDALVYEMPFRIEEIRPVLLNSIEKMLL